MQSLAPGFIHSLRFSASDLSALRELGVCKGKQVLFSRQTPEVLRSLQKVAIIESSESSNRLEGITAPRRRVEALVRKTTEPKNRSEQEIAGYRDALDLLHSSAEHMPFSVNVVLQLHSLTYRYLPGRGGHWKMADNEIVERTPDGTIARVRFRPVSAFATAQAMEDMVVLFRDAVAGLAVEPLVAVPLAILDFLCIHPFADGNGRVSRLITLLLLYHFDYQVGRYISLERVFEESKETYYEALERSSQGWHEGTHDIFPWLNYFWGVLLRAYKEFEDRVATIKTGKGSKTERIRLAVEQRIGPFAFSDIAAECQDISRNMIKIVLARLRDEGAIRLTGKGRGARWVKQEQLNE